MSNKPPRDGRTTIYAMILPHAIKAAYGCGYALAAHGSFVNDLDLVAVPWVDEAQPAESLVRAIADAVKGYTLSEGASCIDGQWVSKQFPRVMPHGRLVWTISFGGQVYIDLSVMPRLTRAADTDTLPP